MKLLENHSKQLIKQLGLTVPEGGIAATPEEVALNLSEAWPAGSD